MYIDFLIWFNESTTVFQMNHCYVTTYLSGGGVSMTYKRLMMLIIFSNCDKEPFFSFWKNFCCSTNWSLKSKSFWLKNSIMNGMISQTFGVINAFESLSFDLILHNSINSMSASKQSIVLIRVWSRPAFLISKKFMFRVDNCRIVDITSSRCMGSSKCGPFSM